MIDEPPKLTGDAAPRSGIEKALQVQVDPVDEMKPASLDGIELPLNGVHHSARPTWKLRETVEFYRDILGLPLIHVIGARAWGPPEHDDFLHFFFDAGNGATIAFFYYIGSDQPDYCKAQGSHYDTATHTAWTVESGEELQLWKDTLEKRGVSVSPRTQHEVLESIYFFDPNGYLLEVARRLRPLQDIDAVDARLTLQAAIDLEDELMAAGERLPDIDSVWQRKAKLVAEHIEG